MTSDTQEARKWGMLCHLSALAWIPLAFLGLTIPSVNLIAPLAIWLWKKQEYEFVNAQGKEALNFQICMSIYGLAIGIPGTFILGIYSLATLAEKRSGEAVAQVGIVAVATIAFLALIAIFQLIVVIMAAVKAYQGEFYRYPLTIRFLQ